MALGERVSKYLYIRPLSFRVQLRNINESAPLMSNKSAEEN